MGESRPAEVLHGPPYSIVSLLVTKGSKTQALHFKFAVPFLLLISRSISQALLCRHKGPPQTQTPFFPTVLQHCWSKKQEIKLLGD